MMNAVTNIRSGGISLHKAFACSIGIHLVMFILVFGVTKGTTSDRKPIIIDFSVGEQPQVRGPARPCPGPCAKPEAAEVQRPIPAKVAGQHVSPAKEAVMHPVPLVQQVTGTGNQAAMATPAPTLNYAPDSGVKAPRYGGDNGAAGPASPSGQAAGQEKPEMRYVKAHFAAIRNSIVSKLSYPRLAKRRGWTGTVKVSFLVNEDGSVSNARVLETSGFEALDNNAVETINRCSPYPKPPCRAEMIMPITYKLDE